MDARRYGAGMDEKDKRDPGAWLPASIVALGLGLTVLLVVMHGPAWMGLVVIGVGAVAQYVARPRDGQS